VVVEQVLDELGVNDRPKLLVFNKTDLLEENALTVLQERLGNLVPSSVFVSSVTDGGLEPLKRSLASAIRARRPLSEIRMSPADGRLLAEIHRGAEVLDQRMDGERLVVTARVDEALAGRLRRAGAEVAGNGIKIARS
jgi:GTP-binding protein HflX